jgi:TonB family protein
MRRSARSPFVAVSALLMAGVVSGPLAAQSPSPPGSIDSTQLANVMRNSLAMTHPAELVLAHRADLALTAEQVTQIEAIAAAQRDSQAVRQQRMIVEMKERKTKLTDRSDIITWTGRVDEQAIREVARLQSGVQAEALINLVRDRHAVGAVLTPSQLALIPRLEVGAMMRGVMSAPARPRSQGGDVPYFEFQVEKQVVTLPGVTPSYPAPLRAAKVEGVVLAQFIVDTMGRFEPGTFRVLKSDHGLFTQSVRDALPEMRFAPAEVGGRKVRQLVQQPFTFALPPQ